MITPSRFRSYLVAVVLLFGSTLAKAAQTFPTWLMLNEVSQETCFVTDPAERARLAGSGWRTNGTGALLATAGPKTAGMQRWVKGFPKGNDRIFSITAEQSIAAKKAGYSNEGVMGQAAATQLTPNMIPVYHFAKDGQNLWLIDKADQTWVEKNGWKLKETAFWIWPKSGA